ncbi:MAG: PH domain-containing protein [Clostridiales bacterium]|nr:PH domain-containing protein [Clostridiales bacterium]
MANTDRLSEYVKEEPILWHDRRRYLGLPLSFTRYSFDSNKFYLKRGLFNTTSDEVLLYRVLDIRLSRTLWQKIFGVGTIVLKTADQTTPVLEIKSVKDSERVKTALSNIVENERNEKRVLGKEMFGTAGHAGIDLDGDGIPDIMDGDIG